MNTLEKRLVVPLLLLAVFANLFLFSVTYTQASFDGYERVLPDMGLSILTSNIDAQINVITENLVWAATTAYEEVQPKVVAFLGLDNYRYGMPRYTALAPRASYESFGSVEAGTSQVLGISIVNSVFQQ